MELGIVNNHSTNACNIRNNTSSILNYYGSLGEEPVFIIIIISSSSSSIIKSINKILYLKWIEIPISKEG